MSDGEIVAVLGYCDEPGSPGMTMHERRDDCTSWTAQVAVTMVNGSPLVTLDGLPIAWYEDWILSTRERAQRERA